MLSSFFVTSKITEDQIIKFYGFETIYYSAKHALTKLPISESRMRIENYFVLIGKLVS